ncbi:Z1 domain-containing protein [Micromonospora tarensis]|uniref:Z1 domain-containing protein n=1 Tax=Micromonospora tarensis TaxID=2806100 RepID=A0ABS1YAW3_9ACTN|nr:Z1 domain-containing protein [Micromonospora tarensis]MBM0274513.1 Z1 domain-containing protein [Micromonospora tarensis]
MNDPLATAYREALRAMEIKGPRALHTTAAFLADDATVVTTDASLRAYLVAADPNDVLRKELAIRLATWDAADDAQWIEGTDPHTAARRDRVASLLRVDDKTAVFLAERFPIATSTFTVIDAPWDPWYADRTDDGQGFYWDHYSRYLAEKSGFDGDAIAALDAATTSVVERLADPTRSERHQAKGLVVGYVQSGKTANFTGVIAKAIDAGYRLVIVLTGSTVLLRTQTQRRLDMELVGRENLLRGISEDDTESFDYHDDPDWLAGKFLRHGVQPSGVGHPDIIRLTTREVDYNSLLQGIAALDFDRRDPRKPYFHPDNLIPTPARLVVMKKNGQVLRKLVKDLGKITARLGEIPALVIDDESDQASPNTSNPRKWKEDQKERTSINRLIGELLTLLPRAQYVGYTATPFANVFIDPSDAEDIFPKDFIIALDQPSGYMGAKEFHDFDGNTNRTFANSRVATHVRYLPDDDAEDDPSLSRALDAFVLTGAVKLYRESQGLGPFRHHTMLVHEGMKRSVHREQATVLRDLWQAAGYYSPASANRLRAIYEGDLLPVSRAVAPDLPMPDRYEDLAPYLARAVRRIGETGDPVLVVNSEPALERAKEQVNFDKLSVWRILVGGNKLSRGFTVEGLTVSYYRRMTKQQDTLMQMGRWFGFRGGYRDLVRLYITPTLHEAFEAGCLDEESFRGELRRYAMPIGGRPQVTPACIPPLVAQHLSWLKPTATNKMYNTVLTERRSPGTPIEPRCYPSDEALIRRNTEAFAPVLHAASQEAHLHGGSGEWDYRAFVGSISHQLLVAALGSLWLAMPDYLTPDLRWLSSLTPDQIDRWVVIFPQQVGGATRRRILGHAPTSVFARTRPRRDYYSTLSEVDHRRPISLIKIGVPEIGDETANRLVGTRTGTVMVYPTVDRPNDRSAKAVPGEPGDELRSDKVTLAFRLVAPVTAIGEDRRLVTFSTIDGSLDHEAIIDRSR